MTIHAATKPCRFCQAPNESRLVRCDRCGSPLTADCGYTAEAPWHAGEGLALDRFRLRSLVHASKVRSVFRAFDHQMGTECWILALHQDVAPESLDLLESALTTIRGLRHTNIAGLEDVLTEDGRLVAIYTDLAGEGLATWFPEAARHQDRTPLAWFVIGAVVDALEFAHAHGVAHGALDESSIAITQGPEGTTVRVVGFGIEHALGSRYADWTEKVTTDLEAVALLARRLLGVAADDPTWRPILGRATARNIHERHASAFAFATAIAPYRPARLPIDHPIFPLPAGEGRADQDREEKTEAPGTSLGGLLQDLRKEAPRMRGFAASEQEVEEGDAPFEPVEDVAEECIPETERALDDGLADAFGAAGGAMDTFELDDDEIDLIMDESPPEEPEPAKPVPPPAPQPAPATTPPGAPHHTAPARRSAFPSFAKKSKAKAVPEAARMPTTGRERLAEERPAVGGEPGTVTRTETYFLNARYFSRMIRGQSYPIDLLATSKEIRRVLREHQAEVSADTGVRVTKTKQTMRFVPRFPGCLAVPAESSFQVSRELVTPDEATTQARTQMWVTPLATGSFLEASIDVYVDGEYLMALRTPTTVVTHVLAKISIVLAVVLPILSSILRGFELTLEDQIRKGFPVLQWLGENCTGPIWHVALFILFAAVASLTWYFRRAQVARAVEPLGSLD
ncbi:MAG: hypothetical protein H6834_16295 [Planctomycetes bacterium]|nr:hypothetical protein [Planctomycetota bacterium]